jgi:hypothetical protein
MISRRKSMMSTVAALAALPAGTAFAQGQPIVGIQTVTTYTSEGRISQVDQAARTVTIAFPNGSTRTHTVSPAVANFSAARIGDNVSVGFEDHLTFVLSGRNTAVPADRNVSVTAAASSGQSVAGAGLANTINNWWVVGVDPAAGTLTLVDQGGGPVRTYKVETQAGREQLPRVKVGDSVTAINSQALVIAITPKA